MGNSKWIDDNVRYRSRATVLIGSEIYRSKWIEYEIKKAYSEKRTIWHLYTQS